jgi:hypothetical protein
MGVEAALLAADGFTAHDSVFEAERGYVETIFGDEFIWDDLLAGLGSRWNLAQHGFNIKLAPRTSSGSRSKPRRAAPAYRALRRRPGWTASSVINTSRRSRSPRIRSASIRFPIPCGFRRRWRLR